MNRIAKSLTATAILAVLVLSTISMIPVNSSGESADISMQADETIPFTIYKPLVFNETDAVNSVKTINASAGLAVCEYNDSVLTFTHSVKIVYAGSATDANIFTFNSQMEQGICVKGDCTVEIYCTGDNIKQVSKSGAVICCDSASKFKFSGSGTLTLNVAKTVTITNTFHCISAKGALTFDSNNLNCRNGYGNGIETSGNYVHLIKGDMRIIAEKYGIHLAGTGDNTLEFEQCNAGIGGKTRAVKSEGSLYTYNSFCTLYGADNINDEYVYPINNIGSEQFIQLEANDLFGLDGSTFLIIVGAVIGIVLIIVIIIVIKKRKNGYRAGPNTGGSSAVYYEPRMPSAGNEDQWTAQYEPRAPSANEIDHVSPVKDVAKYEPQERPSSTGSPSKDKTEITVYSEVKDMTSFALTVDGRVIGYIGNNKSTLDVPRGMHDVRILVNDMDRKEIFRENILLNRPMTLTVVKKFRGYAVEKK